LLARANWPAAPEYRVRSRHRRRYRGQRRDLHRLRPGPERRGRGHRRGQEFQRRHLRRPGGCGCDANTSNGSIRIGEVARGSVVLGTPAGDLEIGIAEGTAARLEVNTGHGHVHNLMENATRPEEAHETVEVRGQTSYGDITIRRPRLASGTGEEGQP